MSLAGAGAGAILRQDLSTWFCWTLLVVSIVFLAHWVKKNITLNAKINFFIMYCYYYTN